MNDNLYIKVGGNPVDITLNSNPFLTGVSTDQNITLVDGANVPIVPIVTGNEIKVIYSPCPVPDETYNVYVNDILQSTFIIPSQTDETININI